MRGRAPRCVPCCSPVRRSAWSARSPGSASFVRRTVPVPRPPSDCPFPPNVATARRPRVMTVLAERTALHIPTLHFFEHDGITYAVDGDAPNWIAVEQRGAELLRAMGEAPPAFGALVARYAAQYQVEAGKAWLHVHDFLTALDRA